MNLIVQKYGGSSVGSIQHIHNVADHVTTTVKAGHRVVVTISAMGEQTDELTALALQISKRPPRREMDMLLTAGERISMALLSMALHERAVPSVSLTGSQSGILTDEVHGNARIHRILGDRIKSGLQEGKVVIVAGFQGVSPKTKEVTTLGRGGTDLTAIALAAALGASRCQLYKDVRGVHTADPRAVPGAKVLQTLSWRSMSELAWGGANVLHTRAAHLASKYSIPFEIRSSLELELSGTSIQGATSVEQIKVEALAHKMDMTLVEIEITGGSHKGPLMGLALEWLWQSGESPVFNMQTRSGTKECLTQLLRTSAVDDCLEHLRESLRPFGSELKLIRCVEALATISIVGDGFQQSPETIQRICRVLPTPPILIDTRNSCVTLCVKDDDLKDCLRRLHDELIEAGEPSEIS